MGTSTVKMLDAHLTAVSEQRRRIAEREAAPLFNAMASMNPDDLYDLCIAVGKAETLIVDEEQFDLLTNSQKHAALIKEIYLDIKAREAHSDALDAVKKERARLQEIQREQEAARRRKARKQRPAAASLSAARIRPASKTPPPGRPKNGPKS